MAASPRQAEIRQDGLLRPQAVEVKSDPEEKQPGQQGKIVRGDEDRGGKARGGGDQIGVPARGQVQNRNAPKAEKAAVHIPHQQEEDEAEGQP